MACVTPGEHAERKPKEDGYTFVDVGDAWLRVKVSGPKDSKKTPLLLLHGFGSRLETWNRVQDALDDDRMVISFDHRGFGHSERTDGAYGPRAHAEDAFKVLDALDVDAAVLAGHSYGGGVALRMAVTDQRDGDERVKGVVLVDAFALAAQVPSSFRMANAPVLGEFIFSTLFVEAPGEKYVLAFHDGQRFATAKVLDEVRELQSRPGSTFAELETVRGMDYELVEQQYASAVRGLPRAIVWGENDKVTPLRQGKVLAATLDASLTVVPNCGHVPSWERPTQVIAVIEGVLADVDAAPTTTSTAPPAPADKVINAVPTDDESGAR
jgi:pimeloyl-ACP methyl ester carboxylesterase